MTAALLHLVPSLLLLAALVLRRYPGERRLLALTQVRRGRGRGRSAQMPMPSRPRASVPRGGLLIGSALAVRPPPGLLAAT